MDTSQCQWKYLRLGPGSCWYSVYHLLGRQSDARRRRGTGVASVFLSGAVILVSDRSWTFISFGSQGQMVRELRLAVLAPKYPHADHRQEVAKEVPQEADQEP